MDNVVEFMLGDIVSHKDFAVDVCLQTPYSDTGHLVKWFVWFEGVKC